MIVDKDIDAPQAYQERIGTQDVMRPILTLKGPGLPLSLLRSPKQSLSFADIIHLFDINLDFLPFHLC